MGPLERPLPLRLPPAPPLDPVYDIRTPLLPSVLLEDAELADELEPPPQHPLFFFYDCAAAALCDDILIQVDKLLN